VNPFMLAVDKGMANGADLLAACLLF